MITQNSVRVSAPAAVVWSIFTDIERWPALTPSVSWVQPLDGAGIELGRRFRIKQPRLPVLVWRISDVDPGRSWTWVARSAGARSYARHEVLPDGDAAAEVTQSIDQRGPLGVVVGALLRGLTHRYLALEAEGLKAASEGRAQIASQP